MTFKNTIILTSILGVGLSFNLMTYAAESTSKVSQTCINLIKSESAKPNSATAKVSSDFTVTLNGKAVTLSDPIVVDQGSTLLPVRAIANLLGIQVDYDSSYKVAIATTEDTTLEIPLGHTFGVNNGQKQNIKGARSILFNAKTYLPVRFVSEQLSGVSIDYIAATKTISIITDGSVIVTPTPPPTASATGNTPQSVFNRAGSIKDIDASQFKKFTSEAQVKQLLPSAGSGLNDTGFNYVVNNMTYVTVTMDMTKKWDNYTFNGIDIVLDQNEVTMSGIHNSFILFKDGTTSKFCKVFQEGKTLKDIKYMAYSLGDTFIIITPGTVDLTNLQKVS